ncbi:hypothetical protein [Nostoc sp.]|uniref:hypothetical protein n=1 Tax=Nostoc sp. TaxID=1180 RepID=UPI002FF6F866
MFTQPITKKAIAYVINKDKLMVFTHTEFPEAGVQVPVGTVKKSEEPSKTVLQEIYK